MSIEFSAQSLEEIEAANTHPSTVPTPEATYSWEGRELTITEFAEEFKAMKERLESSIKTNEFLDSQVKDLRETLASVRADLQQRRIDHVRDITLIGQTLIEKAEEHDWCRAYDSAVDEINQKLTIELPLRQQEFIVTGTVTFPFSARVTLSADADEDEAEEEIKNFGTDDLAIDYSMYNREVEINSVERD